MLCGGRMSIVHFQSRAKIWVYRARGKANMRAHLDALMDEMLLDKPFPAGEGDCVAGYYFLHVRHSVSGGCVWMVIPIRHAAIPIK